MRLWKLLGIGVVSLGLLFVLHQAVNALVKAHNWKGLGTSDWATWVQAVGSVVAIIAGFIVANRQAKFALHLAHLDHIEAGNERLDAILTAAEFASNSLDVALTTIFAPQPPNSYHRDSADFMNASIALDAIPLLDLGSGDVIRSVFRIKHCMSELSRLMLSSTRPGYFDENDRNEFERAIDAIRVDKNSACETIKAEVERGRERLRRHGQV